MSKENKPKGKVREFFSRNREVILLGGIGGTILIVLAYLNSSSNKKMSVKLDTLKVSETPDVKYLGRDGVVLSSFISNEEGGEFIANGITLGNMGEFGKDVVELLGVSSDAELSSINFYTNK